MSASRNTDSLVDSSTGGSGEFSSRIERSEPLTTTGHQPGKLVGNDAVPTFHAQILPPGTAPPESTFKPNVGAEELPSGQPPAGSDPEAPAVSAADTLTGATSADVHTGLGHPGSGQSSAELRHDGDSHRKAAGPGGLEGVTSTTQSEIDGRDPTQKDQRALANDDAEVGRGNNGGLPAQEREPETAETVASENP